MGISPVNSNVTQYNALQTTTQTNAVTAPQSEPLISKELQSDLKSAWELAMSARKVFGSENTSTLDKIKNGLKLTENIGNFLKNQIGIDSKNGVGLIDGALEFSDQFSNALKLYESASKIRSVEDVGKLGQDLVLKNFKAELIRTAAKEFGVDASKLTVEGVGKMAWEYLNTGTITTQASASGISAATEGAAVVGEGAASMAATGSAAAAGEGAAVVATEGATAAAAGEGVAGAGAGAAASEGSLMATGGKILGAAGAAYAAYGLIDNWGKSTPQMGAVQGATVGAYIGSSFGPVGTVVGGAIGLVVGGALGFIHTGKSKDQLARDQVRKGMQEIGMLDKDWGLQLADGSTFDVGKDGKHELNNLDGTTRRMYEVDLKHPLAGQVIGWTQPLAEVLCGGNEKLKTQFCAYFTNAALSNATNLETAKLNVLSIYKNSTLDGNQILSGLQGLQSQSQITADEFAAYVNGIQTLAA